jgi:hypothetical protein
MATHAFELKLAAAQIHTQPMRVSQHDTPTILQPACSRSEVRRDPTLTKNWSLYSLIASRDTLSSSMLQLCKVMRMGQQPKAFRRAPLIVPHVSVSNTLVGHTLVGPLSLTPHSFDSLLLASLIQPPFVGTTPTLVGPSTLELRRGYQQTATGLAPP